MPADTDPDLDAAYALQTPDDNRRLYAAWADTYDAGFAVDMQYILPAQVARVFSEVYQGAGPVLDVGAGTGLLAEALSPRPVMDALDISPDMLAVARGKGLYRECIEADLVTGQGLPTGPYDAVVSSGTFTHGHLGPDALERLLALAAPGAQFAVSVNAAHFVQQGFAAKLEVLAPKISALSHVTVDIYGPGADPDHANDQARILLFRNAP